MSFHYLIKFTNQNSHYKLFDNSITSVDDLKNYYNQNRYINFFIRFENLNKSLIKLFEQIGLNITEEKLLKTKPVNRSNRFSNIDDYYDKETKEMVKYFDALIFSLHKY